MSTRTLRVAPDAQRDRALPLLFGAAIQHKLIQHSVLRRCAGLQSHWQDGDLLRAVNIHCATRGLPPLGALVVRFDRAPGDGYRPSAPGATLESDRELCWRFFDGIPMVDA